jgi:hypothetical protein
MQQAFLQRAAEVAMVALVALVGHQLAAGVQLKTPAVLADQHLLVMALAEGLVVLILGLVVSAALAVQLAAGVVERVAPALSLSALGG